MHNPCIIIIRVHSNLLCCSWPARQIAVIRCRRSKVKEDKVKGRGHWLCNHESSGSSPQVKERVERRGEERRRGVLAYAGEARDDDWTLAEDQPKEIPKLSS